MVTLSQLIDESSAYDPYKSDYAVDAKDLAFVPSGEMNLPTAYGNVLLKPTEHAYTGVFTRLGEVVYDSPLPRKHMLGIPRNLMAHDLNTLMPMMNSAKRAPWLIRGYDDIARASLTAEYTPVDNTEVLKTVAEAVTNRVFKCEEINQPIVTADQIYVKITGVNVQTQDGNYGIGAMVRNDEIGKGRVAAMGYLKRGKCDNSIIFPAENFALSRVHRGSIHRIMYELYTALQDAFKLSVQWLDKMMQAERMQLPRFDSLIDDMALKYGWSDQVKTNVSIGTESRTTVAGMVHGMTYAAHTALNGEAQIELETLAGQWLQMMVKRPEYQNR